MYFAGDSRTMFDGVVGFTVVQNGNARQYLKNSLAGPCQCNYWYDNPLEPDNTLGVPSVLQRINEITFTLATDMSRRDPSNDIAQKHNYTGTLYQDSVHYVSHYLWMWGAIASTLTCVLLVLPTYWGIWELGRKVTLGPFEIAHAFRSPMIAHATQSTVEDIMKQVG